MSGTGVESYTFDKDVVEKAYAGWAPIYDVVFGAIFAPGRAAAVRAAERIGVPRLVCAGTRSPTWTCLP